MLLENGAIVRVTSHTEQCATAESWNRSARVLNYAVRVERSGFAAVRPRQDLHSFVDQKARLLGTSDALWRKQQGWLSRLCDARRRDVHHHARFISGLVLPTSHVFTEIVN